MCPATLIRGAEHLGGEMAAQPGWYEAPGESGMLRYWSGDAWTEHRQPAPPVGAPVVPAAASWTDQTVAQPVLQPVMQPAYASQPAYALQPSCTPAPAYTPQPQFTHRPLCMPDPQFVPRSAGVVQSTVTL